MGEMKNPLNLKFANKLEVYENEINSSFYSSSALAYRV